MTRDWRLFFHPEHCTGKRIQIGTATGSVRGRFCYDFVDLTDLTDLTVRWIFFNALSSCDLVWRCSSCWKQLVPGHELEANEGISQPGAAVRQYAMAAKLVEHSEPYSSFRYTSIYIYIDNIYI